MVEHECKKERGERFERKGGERYIYTKREIERLRERESTREVRGF